MVGSEYRASLTDPDGGITALTWQWAKGASSTGPFTDISGATSANYTPVDADDNEYLRAKANYNDAQGSGKSALRVSNRQASASPFNPPSFAVDSVEFNLAENTPGPVTVGTVAATDDDGDTVYYSLGGPDAGAFTSETSLSQPGASIILQVFTALDYETKQSYSLVLSVTDREDEDGNPQTNHTVDDTVQITVNVLNVEEPGRLVINPVSLEQGINATASLTDPDGSLSNINWQWSRSDEGTGPFSDISGETGPNYVPVLSDKHKFLRISVSYTDGQGPGKSAELLTYVYAGTTTTEPNPVDFPKNGHTMGALRVGETSTGRLDAVDDNLHAPEHADRIPRGDMFRIEGLTAGNSYRVRAWFGASKADSATPDRGGDIHLYGGRGDPGSIYSLGKYYDDLLEDGLATFAFPAHANEDYYLSVIAPAFRYDNPAVPAHDYYGPYMLEIYDLGPTQTPSQPEGYGIKATNVCVNNRCFNDPQVPGVPRGRPRDQRDPRGIRGQQPNVQEPHAGGGVQGRQLRKRDGQLQTRPDRSVCPQHDDRQHRQSGNPRQRQQRGRRKAVRPRAAAERRGTRRLLRGATGRAGAEPEHPLHRRVHRGRRERRELQALRHRENHRGRPGSFQVADGRRRTDEGRGRRISQLGRDTHGQRRGAPPDPGLRRRRAVATRPGEKTRQKDL